MIGLWSLSSVHRTTAEVRERRAMSVLNAHEWRRIRQLWGLHEVSWNEDRITRLDRGTQPFFSVSEDLLCAFELLKPLDGPALRKEMTKAKRKR